MPIEDLWKQINSAYRVEETSYVETLMAYAKLSPEEQNLTQKTAKTLIEQVRDARKNKAGIDSFLTEYSLSGEEGIALMCLAEAFLRVPDKNTIDSLIKDKLTDKDWHSHAGQSGSFFINATTWALMLTGKILKPESAQNVLSKALMKLINKTGETIVRQAVHQAMNIMSKQFVMGRTINEGLKRAKKAEAKGYRFSYDMLGEAALTAVDAKRYFESYKNSIISIGESAGNEGDIYSRPGISIKLSALHPRYEDNKRERVLTELVPQVLELANLAKEHHVGMTIDAEESERLMLSLEVIAAIFKDKRLNSWDGLGIAVQSYQKRAFYVLDWLYAMARQHHRHIMVRLIKGAYWDSEIKKTQMKGLVDYPVFTRKAYTDVSFQACAKKILTMNDVIYPQFATHNAYSVAMILSIIKPGLPFEFQCLHGMGEALYEQIVPKEAFGIPCRVYAPIGSHEDLLPYLVRRLLENGANTSFVNRIVDETIPFGELITDPLQIAQHWLGKDNINIPNPAKIFLPARENSQGFDFTDRELWPKLEQDIAAGTKRDKWISSPLPLAGRGQGERVVTTPTSKSTHIGSVIDATQDDIENALKIAKKYTNTWSNLNVSDRAAMLRRFAALLEENQALLMAVISTEAGKTLFDAIGEIREAIDFCYYYANQAEKLLANPLILQGYTGEQNELSLHGRGVIVCISPWNFPLAIFVGQIVAALVTGNCVIAKPAEQTPLVAWQGIQLMYKAGIPKEALHLLPGTGTEVGARLVGDPRVSGVLFTGSTETAARIHQVLASRGGPIVPLIAETGGINAMIVDSTALLEQVVVDVITSAFGSAGQRCSALRAVFIQEEVYDKFIQLLTGAMAELKIGDPRNLDVDIGPVIDAEALAQLQAHVKNMREHFDIIYQCELPDSISDGYFMPPTAIALDSIKSLKREVFGPILHVICYAREELDKIIDDINQTGFGLTLGIHSRINETVAIIHNRLAVGNCYVNRNMIGAVVGLQPFGGEGLSGTGPKAGGPYYLQRLCHERTLTVDTTAAGGNASLMSLPET